MRMKVYTYIKSSVTINKIHYKYRFAKEQNGSRVFLDIFGFGRYELTSDQYYIYNYTYYLTDIVSTIKHFLKERN